MERKRILLSRVDQRAICHFSFANRIDYGISLSVVSKCERKKTEERKKRLKIQSKREREWICWFSHPSGCEGKPFHYTENVKAQYVTHMSFFFYTNDLIADVFIYIYIYTRILVDKCGSVWVKDGRMSHILSPCRQIQIRYVYESSIVEDQGRRFIADTLDS